MKKLYISLTLLFAIGVLAIAQSPANRTHKTIVADVLAQLPAEKPEVFNQQFADLASTGEEGVMMIVDLLNGTDATSIVRAEYALGGLAAYISGVKDEALKNALIQAYLKATQAARSDANKAFLIHQLEIMGCKELPQLPDGYRKAEAAATPEITPATGATNTRIAEQYVAFSDGKKKPAKLAEDALKDDNREYRNAVLGFASPYADASMYVGLIKAISKAKPEVKVDVLNWLGREAADPKKQKILTDLEMKFEHPARTVFINYTKDANFEVKTAAVWLLTRIGDKRTIPHVAALLTGTDTNDIALAQSALASYPGDIDTIVAKTIPQAQDAGKIACLELLALRKANGNSNAVYAQTESTSPEVKAAAYKALKDVVIESDFVRLCGMLETAEESAVSPLQQAIIAAIATLPPTQSTQLIQRRMIQAGHEKHPLYYIPLAATQTVSMNTPENNYLELRKAMEIAQTDVQKNGILQQIQKTNTFQGMIFAGKYLDDKATRQAAAQAVMNIGLNNPQYTGTVVRELLEKTSQVLDNPDASYQREAIRKHLSEMPAGEGFVSIFNGIDLTGWKGLVGDPLKRAKMNAAQLAREQKKADEQMRKDWFVEDGMLVFDGAAYDNLCTEKQYGDIEMYIEWKLDTSGKDADAGVYLRGTPQVQIWDTARVHVGAQVGSGGLYNNKVHASKPTQVADNQLGEWNTFYIKMVGDRVTVILNGKKVTDNVILENFWDRNQPIFPVEQLELQAHGSKVYYRDIYVKELPRTEPFQLSAQEKKEGYKVLFDGTNMYEWIGNTVDYTMEDGTISLIPSTGSGGNLYTKSEYGNFIFRFEFQLTPAANNGLGIRTPMEGDPAYVGMELQILDDDHPVYKDLEEYQYHGSVYGIIAAKRGALKPVGEWNYQEVVANGDHIKITLNGQVIVDGNLKEATKDGTVDGKEHPGMLNAKGHIGFLGHGSQVKFRNVRVRELK